MSSFNIVSIFLPFFYCMNRKKKDLRHSGQAGAGGLLQVSPLLCAKGLSSMQEQSLCVNKGGTFRCVHSPRKEKHTSEGHGCESIFTGFLALWASDFRLKASYRCDSILNSAQSGPKRRRGNGCPGIQNSSGWL